MEQYSANDERSPLIVGVDRARRNKPIFADKEVSFRKRGIKLTKGELIMSETTGREHLPYNDYATIDFLRDLVSCLASYVLCLR